ncbi:hypothetical protein [Bacillus sp. D386]|uniref:hypothetical protein n=1 Tax=Bacillus sp. D386 TaxID=2587155 RepID=UPI001120F650|nr:hypothetical protein [Bacillus sp. D386]
MPKIHRIRIVGLKYDGMQKQYKDTTFDFHNEQTSTNGLIAMMNGGGKGVFLQSIFQVLKPGTAWGKQNNRFYQQFFFNKKEQFAPYTFHILIEWELDGSDGRHLVTGGMFSAEQKKLLDEDLNEETGSDEREAKIVPNITFYAREFDRKEDVALEHIPLYENGQVADPEELKDYFKWNGFDVYRDIKKHYRILDTYGINRKDWDIMKEINRDEGGVGKYFEGAEDDHSLFQKRIIPTVSQVLNKAEAQKNDLIEIFKSQASIAKDLPVLLKREQAHKEFLEDIVPFEDHVRIGVEHEEIVQASTKEGQQLLGALEHVIKQEKEELISLETEIEQLTKQLSVLRFEKDNLEYAKAHQDVRKWEEQLQKNKEKHEQLKEVVAEKQAIRDEFTFSLLLKEWSEFENTILNLTDQMSKLEQNSGLEQVNQRMEEIKAEVTAEWEKANLDIAQSNNQYHAYKKYLTKRIKESSSHDKQKTIEIAKLSAEILSIQDELQSFEVKSKDMSTQFGDRITYDLSGLISHFKQNLIQLQEELKQLQDKDQQTQEFQNELSGSLGTLRESLKHLNSKRDNWKEAYQKQDLKESSILERMKLVLDDVSPSLTHALLSKYAAGIEGQLTQNQEESEQVKKELWESQLDHYLNDENFWIANQDLKEFKEWIDEKTGIDVFYGTQYLQSLDEDERLHHLESYPLLPFGLVVSRNQWEKINHHLLQGRLFKSPVPVYLREEMNGTPVSSFVVLHGEEHELITNRNEFMKWKIAISKKIEEKKDVLDELGKSERSLRRLYNELNRMTDTDLCVDIAKFIEQEEKEISKADTELKRTVQILDKEKELHAQLREQLNQKVVRIEECGKHVDALEAFILEKEKYEEHKQLLEAKEVHKATLIAQQAEIAKDLDELNDRSAQWNQTYLEWKLAIDQSIKEIVQFVHSASFPPAEKMEGNDEVPSLSLHILDKIMGQLNELKLLQRSKEEQAQELLTLKAQKEAEMSQKSKLEKKLAKQHEDWRERPVPDEPISILEGLQQTAQKEAKEADKEERKQDKEVTVAETSLNLANEQAKKAQKKLSKHEQEPEKWEDQDLDVKEVEIKDRTKLTKKQLDQTEKKLKETNERINGYEGDQLTLSVILKENPVPYTDEVVERIKNQGKSCILAWCEAHQNFLEEKQVKHAKLEQSLRKLKLTIEDKDWEIRFKNEVLTSLDHMDTRHYAYIETIISNMKRFSRSGLEQLDRDKERAEKAQDFWASRASMKVMSMSDAIRSMIAKMKIKNERGTFPLVQLKEDLLPKNAEEVEPLLKQHFVMAIDKITKQFETIDDHNKALEVEIKQLISDEQILFVSLRNRFPELLVYNMRTDNAFKYGRPQKEHYSTWKTINQGSKTKSDGSGGQKLSARMVMMMMLLSVKSEADNSWVSLVCDNPFGQAASAHVLDPIFAVAEKLKFQLIVVTPPELVKTEISQRFDSYYKLDFVRENGKEIVTDTVVPAYRIYQEEEVLES